MRAFPQALTFFLTTTCANPLPELSGECNDDQKKHCATNFTQDKVQTAWPRTGCKRILATINDNEIRDDLCVPPDRNIGAQWGASSPVSSAVDAVVEEPYDRALVTGGVRSRLCQVFEVHNPADNPTCTFEMVRYPTNTACPAIPGVCYQLVTPAQ